MNYLICYDICEPKRLQRIAKTLEKYGIRVQYSFFEVDISEEMLNEIVKALSAIAFLKEDKIYVYPICDECRKKVIIDGTGAFLPLQSYIIL